MLVTAGVRDYPYNFRYAALLLVGIVIVYGGVLCIAAVSGLARRKRAAVSRAASGLLLLIIVSVPLIPMQPELAGGLTFVGTLNLVILLLVRRDFSR